MLICEQCNCGFDEIDAERQFSIYFAKPYENLVRKLCFECAADVMNGEWDGEYFETCDCCGKRFDYFIDMAFFEEINDDIAFEDSWGMGIKCAQCGLESVM